MKSAVLLSIVAVLTAQALGETSTPAARQPMLQWTALPPLPDDLGVAGPFVGVHNDVLIVAGGANFPIPHWETGKAWHKDAWVLKREASGAYRWASGLALDRPVAYGSVASTSRGVVCLGGSDGHEVHRRAFILRWNADSESLEQLPLPDLPEPHAYGAAASIGDVVYVVGGQSTEDLASASADVWRLDLSAPDPQWEKRSPLPGPGRAFHVFVAQHNGFETCLYVMGGRRQKPGTSGIGGIEPLSDTWEYSPGKDQWRRRADMPQPRMAGSAAAVGQAHVFVLSGDDGALMSRAGELKLDHPGFPKQVLAYHTITDRWIDAGPSPASPVTTPAVWWGGKVVVVSGEVKPRVRTTEAWAINPVTITPTFGVANFTVLVLYLLAMVGVGVYFARRNSDTDDYFRGGKKVIWWAAGCSIFATMLSSITYMAIPAKAFAQDHVYLLGNLMIPVVAPIAVYLALPFFRRIDATSAYEYLEKRFNRPVRLLASGSFTLFHVFRMGIVMSLAALALATVTPLTPVQSVLIMGVLSVIYCAMGGVEAVIWTDTIQTVVLLGGAVLCLVLMFAGVEGGVGEALSSAYAQGKLHAVNFHLDATSASLAMWVVILGGIGQNVSSYTADQAVVQRYMTTPDERRAARSIWFAALMAIPSSILFYFMGTGLYAFYQSHPEKLDPTFMTDQIFPLFIARELPAGMAGLVVAGIFAAAQSTISTSMNSTATAVVTDFLRPFRVFASERAYLNAARALTVTLGAAGTAIGLLFVQPQIMSLFDQFIKVVGLFMGVLGGLFLLGMLTRRVGGAAALIGALAGVAVMSALPLYSRINGYLYAAIGIGVCFAVGYLLSVVLPARHRAAGMTIYDHIQDATPGEHNGLDAAT